ncbi:hypothetical protein [Natranaerobius thermophilus]|uniref:Uncharacterized protein n=1 Tax=Natranaerobius thermophilus (strain ATCC BAA-1301 / DSM 18059 / JW/NM-WN-LF) TaxID=457570 RepID=B2A4I7_NATTJ|nr:hypothetical protein [Natranaerobius thermophilus]ACB85164.1 hypothetical protein Nther_1589 [Natranaerobius thermophilus JW/NM-WN-LF]
MTTIDPKKIVLEWIEENFEKSSIELVDYPMMLGGTLIRDKKGNEMIVYYEFMRNQVNHIILD